MILSYGHYEFLNKRGIVFFHQKSPAANSQAIANKIFTAFKSVLKDMIKDQDSTRLQSPQDMGHPEIQLLESAKIKTLRSFPQNSLYWGTELFFIHCTRDHTFMKLPKWLTTLRLENNSLQEIDLDNSWTRLDNLPNSTFFIKLRMDCEMPARIIDNNFGSIRLAPIFSAQATDFAPLFSLGTLSAA